MKLEDGIKSALGGRKEIGEEVIEVRDVVGQDKQRDQQEQTQRLE